MNDGTYSGIGSRETPNFVLDSMTNLAHDLRADHGMTLRSGRAPGADQAFEAGAGDEAEIFKPWRAFEKDFTTPFLPTVHGEPTEAAIEAAKAYHPAWERLGWGGQRLMGRNMHIVLGYKLDDPVDFIVAWTPGGEMKGGTAQALRVAESLAIPVYNLFHKDAQKTLMEELNE